MCNYLKHSLKVTEKLHRASRAGRGHDKKANKSEHSFHSEIDEKRQEKERAGNQRRNPKVKKANKIG